MTEKPGIMSIEEIKRRMKERFGSKDGEKIKSDTVNSVVRELLKSKK